MIHPFFVQSPLCTICNIIKIIIFSGVQCKETNEENDQEKSNIYQSCYLSEAKQYK